MSRPPRPLPQPSSVLRALAAPLALVAFLGLGGCKTNYEYESFSLGDGAEGRPREPLGNSQFVRGAYVDLLDRTPAVYDYEVQDAQGAPLYSFPIDEKATAAAALDAMSDPLPMRSLICAGLLRSAEASVPEKAEVDDPAAFIREQFRVLLGRDPGAYEARAFEEAWIRDEAVGPRTVIRAIVGSREYQSR
jgi:hypothetical protein